MAQLYQQEFKAQEKAKYEHIRQAKEKALEEQRISEENKRRVEAEKQAESDKISREHDKTTEQSDTERAQEVSDENENEGGVSNTATSDTIGSDWSSVSPQDYLDKAVSIYQGSGGTAWVTW